MTSRWLLALVSIWAGVAAAATSGANPLLLGLCSASRDGNNPFARMAAVGARSVRFDVPWKQVETKRGAYQMPEWVESSVDEALAANMQPLLILDYGNPFYGNDKPRTPEAIEAFAHYATFVVKHFGSRVRYYELWNEWETRTGGTTPDSPDHYIALARVVYPAIKAANPSATVLMSGTSDLKAGELKTGWVAQFLQLGGLAFVDGVSLHPYNQQGDEQTPEAAINIVDVIHQLAREKAGNRDVSIYVTEMGYPTSGRGSVSEGAQADFLARFLLLAAARPYVAGIWWYGLRDQGGDPGNREHHWGLYRADFEPKPAAEMYSALSALLLESRSVQEQDGADDYRIIVQGSDGQRTVQWRKAAGSVMTFTSAQASRPLMSLGSLTQTPRAPSDLQTR